MQNIAVYQLGDRILVHPWQKTTAGLGMSSGPYITLPLDVGDYELGMVVLDALNKSGLTISHPTDPRGIAKARLEAAGVKSERAFQTGTRYVSAERRGENIFIQPTHNGGTRGDTKGFHSIPDSTITINIAVFCVRNEVVVDYLNVSCN